MSPSIATQPETASILDALRNAQGVLLQKRNGQAHWDGCLSSSALSTAVAVVALSGLTKLSPCSSGRQPAPLFSAEDQSRLTPGATVVEGGLQWLASHQNADGGWGDTPDSPSNLSTTLLCWAALRRNPELEQSYRQAIDGAERMLSRELGSLAPAEIAHRVLAYYGRDRTFSVPILTLCAVCGRLGMGAEAWQSIPQLPFELAALPHRIFKWLRLPVVSYAIPALIAIGLARHENAPKGFHPLRPLRESLKDSVLKVLEEMQPASGGFLEAVPLTGFVVMALVASGLEQHPVAEAGARFLRETVRPDGSWPIDVSLNTWLTALSVAALADAQPGCGNPSGRSAPVPGAAVSGLAQSERHFQTLGFSDVSAAGDGRAPAGRPSQRELVRWFLAQQQRQEHPFTHADPGGWAWTNLPGGVPDADDTSGVLVALHSLEPDAPETQAAALQGVTWLLDLQNRDGGIPTFCRGWLQLPFDRSCPEITAHALAAWSVWQDQMPARLQSRLQAAMRRAVGYLARAQKPEGTWPPLWFGNQHSPGHENPLYGTARVLICLEQVSPPVRQALQQNIERAKAWLLSTQQESGGWGGTVQAPATIEETALAIHALCASGLEDEAVLRRGISWLMEATEGGTRFPASPIGLYFSKLWYSEELYPVIFSCAAFSRAARSL